jgi:hypothetical protein
MDRRQAAATLESNGSTLNIGVGGIWELSSSPTPFRQLRDAWLRCRPDVDSCASFQGRWAMALWPSRPFVPRASLAENCSG